MHKVHPFLFIFNNMLLASLTVKTPFVIIALDYFKYINT